MCECILHTRPMLRAGESWHTRLGVVAVTHDDGVERLVRVRRAIRLAARAARRRADGVRGRLLFAVFPRRFFFFFPRRLDGLGHDAPSRPPLLQVRALVLVRRALGEVSRRSVLGVLGRRRHGDDARPQPDALSDVVVVGVRVQVRAHLLVPAETPVVVRERPREREAAEPHHLAGQVRAQVLVHAAVHSLRAVRVRARQVILHVRVEHPHAPELGALLEDHRVVALARELARGGEAGGARADHGDARASAPVDDALDRLLARGRHHARETRARARRERGERGAASPRERRSARDRARRRRTAARDWRKAHVRSPTSMRRAPPAVTSASQREFPADHEIFSTSPRVHCRRDVVAPAHFEMHAASRAVSGTFASPSRAFHASRGPPPARGFAPAPPPARATSRARSSPRTSDP